MGERVARIVEACSPDTAKGQAKADWRERKDAYLAHLQKAEEDILRVSLADKVHNARCGTTAASPTGSTKDCPANCLKSCVKSSKCWRSRNSNSDISDDVSPCTVV